MHKKITYWLVTASLAGFLFGFDTVAVSHADQRTQALWGTVLGALPGNLPYEFYGQRKTLESQGEKNL